MDNNPFAQLGSLSKKIAKHDDIQNDFFARMHKQDEKLKELRHQAILDKQQYDYDVLDTLKGIERNTGDIAQIITLLQTSSVHQEEVLHLLSEIQSIGASKNIEEADTKYREVMKKVSQLEEDANSIDTLIGYGRVVWTAVKAYLKSNGIDSE